MFSHHFVFPSSAVGSWQVILIGMMFLVAKILLTFSTGNLKRIVEFNSLIISNYGYYFSDLSLGLFLIDYLRESPLLCMQILSFCEMSTYSTSSVLIVAYM